MKKLIATIAAITAATHAHALEIQFLQPNLEGMIEFTLTWESEPQSVSAIGQFVDVSATANESETAIGLDVFRRDGWSSGGRLFFGDDRTFDNLSVDGLDGASLYPIDGDTFGARLVFSPPAASYGVSDGGGTAPLFGFGLALVSLCSRYKK